MNGQFQSQDGSNGIMNGHYFDHADLTSAFDFDALSAPTFTGPYSHAQTHRCLDPNGLCYTNSVQPEYLCRPPGDSYPASYNQIQSGHQTPCISPNDSALHISCDLIQHQSMVGGSYPEPASWNPIAHEAIATACDGHQGFLDPDSNRISPWLDPFLDFLVDAEAPLIPRQMNYQVKGQKYSQQYCPPENEFQGTQGAQGPGNNEMPYTANPTDRPYAQPVLADVSEAFEQCAPQQSQYPTPTTRSQATRKPEFVITIPEGIYSNAYVSKCDGTGECELDGALSFSTPALSTGTSATCSPPLPKTPIALTAVVEGSSLDSRSRNRLAADKCRAKTKANLSKLEDKDRIISETREALMETVENLKGEIFDLKERVFRHHGCGCDMMQEYLNKSAQRIVNNAAMKAAKAGISDYAEA